MSLRLGFDLDGVLADMNAALLREALKLFPGLEAQSAEIRPPGPVAPGDEEEAGETAPLSLRLTERQERQLWEAVRQIPNFWETLQETEPGIIARLAATDPELGLGRVAWFTFGSISALSKWSTEDMAKSGVSTVFVGVESKFAHEHGYAKRAGEAREVLARVHQAGIATMAAWIGGFDFHTPENIQEDLDYFISCKPTYNQLSRVCPFPGTALWKKLREEGRLHDVDWEYVHFYGGGGLRSRAFDAVIHTDVL